MDILQLIKNRRTIRKYQNKPIPKKVINKIIEAGRWGPSPHNSQTWRFIVAKNKCSKTKLIQDLRKESGKLLTSFKIFYNSSIDIIGNAPVIILVYNTDFLSQKVKRFGEPYFSITKLSEIQGISAAIENMCLAATSLGLGTAWLTMPLFGKKQIQLPLYNKYELIAILAIGYPENKHYPSVQRKKISETVKYI